MRHDAVIKDLSKLGFAAVAVDTVERACAYVPWFTAAVAEAVEVAEGNRDACASQAAIRRIKAVLKAASTATAALLARLGTDAGVEQIFECAQRYPFFSELAKFAKGDVAAGQRAAALLASVASHQAGASSTASGKAPQDDAVAGTLAPHQAPATAVAPKHVQYVRTAAGALAYSTEPLEGRQAVLTLDVAAAVRAGDYDWRNRVSVTLSASEAILVFAVLMGQLPSVQIASKGSANRKVAISEQASGFIVQASQGNRAVLVPLSPLDALHLALQVSDVFVAAHPQLIDMDGLLRFAAQFVAKLLPRAA